MALALILRVAASLVPDSTNLPPVNTFDNSGEIHHGSKSNSDLQEKQSQADVLSLLKRYLRALSVPVSFEKVEAHVDDNRPARFRNQEENWNIEMYRLAKFALFKLIQSSISLSPC
mmetsp:Transcript_1676/g.2732  ORF Transcript_1676/g.2732 Transcript_1676/m.2732 type:complete len:116 (-) Transcript_1676:710-1057(-)